MKVYYVDVKPRPVVTPSGNHLNYQDCQYGKTSGPFHDRKIAERAAAGALEAGATSARIHVEDEDIENNEDEE